jgi:NAD(P)-dependent dehydrogenase (short-subunit alcohol dehydrogenase family)
MSKASVAHLIKQLHIEEPDIVALGISPGLCDTAMVKKLVDGERKYLTTNFCLRAEFFKVTDMSYAYR